MEIVTQERSNEIANQKVVRFQCMLVFLKTWNASAFCFRYLVKKDSPGLTATKIANKIGLRIVQNGDILLKKVFVPDEDRLPGVNSFQDTSKVRSNYLPQIMISHLNLSSCYLVVYIRSLYRISPFILQ